MNRWRSSEIAVESVPSDHGANGPCSLVGDATFWVVEAEQSEQKAVLGVTWVVEADPVGRRWYSCI